MKFRELFSFAAKRLKKEGVPFAVSGAVAAILYRDEPRLTGDIDIAIDAGKSSKTLAIRIIEDAGLKATPIREAMLSRVPGTNKKSSPVHIVLGRDPDDKTQAGLDFLLPEIPWVKKALSRAAHNQRDFGFGELPTLTIEDLLLAKVYSIKSGATREKDVDDLKSVLRAGPDIDLKYLGAEFDRLRLSVPRHLEQFLPRALAMASKRMR